MRCTEIQDPSFALAIEPVAAPMPTDLVSASAVAPERDADPDPGPWP